jgi:hypothetical protein
MRTTWSQSDRCSGISPRRGRIAGGWPTIQDDARGNYKKLRRAYDTVTVAHKVVKDAEINACPIKNGQRGDGHLPSPQRGPEGVSDADKGVRRL